METIRLDERLKFLRSLSLANLSADRNSLPLVVSRGKSLTCDGSCSCPTLFLALLVSHTSFDYRDELLVLTTAKAVAEEITIPSNGCDTIKVEISLDYATRSPFLSSGPNLLSPLFLSNFHQPNHRNGAPHRLQHPLPLMQKAVLSALTDERAFSPWRTYQPCGLVRTRCNYDVPLKLQFLSRRTNGSSWPVPTNTSHHPYDYTRWYALVRLSPVPVTVPHSLTGTTLTGTVHGPGSE